MRYHVSGKAGLMVEVAGLWVQWLPATKVQFERFLCETGDVSFDAECYSLLLELNPRVSPRGVTVRNYWGALLTGVLPGEAECFARWVGEGYRLPSDDEWRAIYAAVQNQPPLRLEAEAPLAELGERDRELLARIESAAAGASSSAERFVADQMLLRGGVFEWVEDGESVRRWSGRGMPPTGFFATFYTAGDALPMRFNEPATRRSKACGFRLVRAAA